MKKDITIVVSMTILILLIPYYLEEWAYAIESGKKRAQDERRIRASQSSGGSNPVNVLNFPTPSQRGPKGQS